MSSVYKGVLWSRLECLYQRNYNVTSKYKINIFWKHDLFVKLYVNFFSVKMTLLAVRCWVPLTYSSSTICLVMLWLVCSHYVWLIVCLRTCWVYLKTFCLSAKHVALMSKSIEWWVRIMCQSGVTCLTVHFCFNDLAV